MSVKSVEYLTDILGDFVRESRLVLVAGHPGSGKTTLAASMCLHAMAGGERCLYMSFQEDRERLYKQLAGVGLELKRHEDEGLLKYVKFPTPASEDFMQEFIERLSRLAMDFKPKILVIDSVTSLLEGIKDDARVRGYLQNYFWELQRLVGSTVVLVSEVPLGQDYTSLGGIEFIADAVLILKHRVQRGLLARYMEVRKTRGRPLTVAEVPFSIQSGEGILFHPPIMLSEIKTLKKRKKLLVVGEESRAVELEAPALISFCEYPAGFSPSLLLLHTVLTHAAGDDWRVLIVEYTLPETQVRDTLAELLHLYGADEEVINHVLSRVVIKSINPTAYSTAEGLAKEIALIEEVRPTAVVFHDVGVFTTYVPEDLQSYMTTLYNELLYLKQRGINVIRYCSRLDPRASEVGKLLADHITSVNCADEECTDYTICVAVQGRTVKISWADVEDQVKKMIRFIKEAIQF